MVVLDKWRFGLQYFVVGLVEVADPNEVQYCPRLFTSQQRDPKKLET
jgi:hypothetical protein